LNVLPRLIYFMDKGFFIDGDEAIFGSMVNDFVRHGHLSLFFSGQNYGFVFFEVLAAGLVSFVFGANIFTLKISMLLFWLAGMILLYFLAKKLLASRQWALLATLLVSSVPVWFDWASKARGGYLTALLLSQLIMLLAFSKKTTARIITVSLSLVIIYFAQPLWLVVVLPFVAYYFLKRFNFRQLLLSGAGLVLGFAVLELIFKAIGFHYESQNRLGFAHVIPNLQNLFHNLYVAYSGRFFDVSAAKIYTAIAIDSGLFIGLLFLAIAYNVYLLAAKNIKTSSLLFLLSVIFFLIFMLFYNDAEFSYRYLLPLFLPAIVLIVLTVKDLPSPDLRYLLKIFLAIYAAFSLICGVCFHNYILPEPKDDYSEMERFGDLYGFLKDKHVTCAYDMDWMISQHLNYFTEDIVSREPDSNPRRPDDLSQVDRLNQQTGDCALIGYWYQLPVFVQVYGLRDTVFIDGRYVVHLHPKRPDLLRFGFKMSY
jgi:hypothetical protein